MNLFRWLFWIILLHVFSLFVFPDYLVQSFCQLSFNLFMMLFPTNMRLRVFFAFMSNSVRSLPEISTFPSTVLPPINVTAEQFLSYDNVSNPNPLTFNTVISNGYRKVLRRHPTAQFFHIEALSRSQDAPLLTTELNDITMTCIAGHDYFEVKSDLTHWGSWENPLEITASPQPYGFIYFKPKDLLVSASAALSRIHVFGYTGGILSLEVRHVGVNGSWRLVYIFEIYHGPGRTGQLREIAIDAETGKRYLTWTDNIEPQNSLTASF